MNTKKIFKWVNITAFGFLLTGGFNFLLMGLFGFDMYEVIFGGTEGVVGRIFYGIFGVSAVVLLATVLWRAFMSAKKQTPAKKAQGTSN